VYRNERALSLTYEKIRTVFETTLRDYQFEAVFVDDGSDDGSLAELLALRQADPRVKVISFTRNFGQMAAMLAAFRYTSGDATINISADLQDPVELIPRMVEHWEKGSEIVVCYRTDRSDTVTAKIFSRIAYSLLRLSIPQIPRGGFDFVLMDRTVLDAFNEIDVRNRFFQGDLLWSGYRTRCVPRCVLHPDSVHLGGGRRHLVDRRPLQPDRRWKLADRGHAVFRVGASDDRGAVDRGNDHDHVGRHRRVCVARL
jgi:dolichol-phosphate mannosyltransferase